MLCLLLLARDQGRLPHLDRHFFGLFSVRGRDVGQLTFAAAFVLCQVQVDETRLFWHIKSLLLVLWLNGTSLRGDHWQGLFRRDGMWRCT